MTDNKDNVNWSRFGLDPVSRSESSPPRSHGDQSSEFTATGSTSCGNPNVKDLFDEDQVCIEKWRERGEICPRCQFHCSRSKIELHLHFKKSSFTLLLNKRLF